MAGSSILLIEDDLSVFHGIQRRLKASGYETFYAPDAIASISQARQHRPDLILLDLGLPAGDGYVVMQRLGAIAELAAIPIVILSGRDRAANEMRAFRAGAAAFLQKPVSCDVLLETVQRCLGRRAAAPGAVTYSVEVAAIEKEVPVYAWAANVETR